VSAAIGRRHLSALANGSADSWTQEIFGRENGPDVLLVFTKTGQSMHFRVFAPPILPSPSTKACRSPPSTSRARRGGAGGGGPDPRAARAVTPLPSSAGHADPARSQRPDAQSRRAIELDALSAVLQLGSRDRMPELLSDGEVETLRHLTREGCGRTHCVPCPPTSPISKRGRSPRVASPTLAGPAIARPAFPRPPSLRPRPPRGRSLARHARCGRGGAAPRRATAGRGPHAFDGAQAAGPVVTFRR
jgi:hypothetical protein